MLQDIYKMLFPNLIIEFNLKNMTNFIASTKNANNNQK